MMRKQKHAAVLILLLTFATACIHKSSGAVTPWERVTTYNAMLAEANNTLEQGAEAVATSGLATAAQVRPIIQATGQTAMLHIQVTALLKQGSATQANFASVQTLVDQIKASIAAIPPATLGIKNPKSQQNFSADVSTLGTLADAVLSSLQVVVK
jgi:hypothetical protein